jgi:hypothetical protein
VPGDRRVRIRVEAKSGRWVNRYVVVHQTAEDTDASLLRKAADAYRRVYGWADRIIAIDIHSV